MTVVDWCRHCTNEDVMTLEHMPPKSAGNDQPINFVDEAGTIIREFSEGHAIPALCDGCNNGASTRGLPGAYELWRNDVIAAIEATTAANSKGKPFNIWRTSASPAVRRSTSVTRVVPGSAAATRTPTDRCANTSRATPGSATAPQAELDAIADELNGRPQQALG